MLTELIVSSNPQNVPSKPKNIVKPIIYLDISLLSISLPSKLSITVFIEDCEKINFPERSFK